MTTLHLGVVDIPYADKSGATTGDVAGWLESKYHVMEIFYETHEQEIVDALTESLANVIDTLKMGGSASGNGYPYDAADAKIESAFRSFLTSRDIEGLGYPGVPTQAALDGVSPRFKNGGGPRRPSFVSSGLYEASFKSWVD